MYFCLTKVQYIHIISTVSNQSSVTLHKRCAITGYKSIKNVQLVVSMFSEDVVVEGGVVL